MDVPVVIQVLVTQEVHTTVETPQLQFSDGVVDVPVAMPRQVPTIQRVQNTEDVLQVQCSDIVVDVPVMTQRQVSTIQPAQKTGKVTQAQHIDKVVQVPDVMQRQVSMTIQTSPKTVEFCQKYRKQNELWGFIDPGSVCLTNPGSNISWQFLKLC